MNKKLYKSNSDKKLDGVCAGIGAFFGMDPNLIRVLWAILSVASGGFPGILAYLICAMILPVDPDDYIEV